MSAVDRLFIVTNFEIVENNDNPDRALCRYELFEILVRIANLKYRENGLVQTYAEALQKLLETNIFNKYEPPFAWQKFRDTELWTLDVNDILEANLGVITQVYQKYFKPRKTWMNKQDAYDLMIRHTSLQMLEVPAMQAFGLCKMTVVDEADDGLNRYNKLYFVEFLEMIARIADIKYKGTEVAQQTLTKKIEYVLDEILPLVGAKRQEVDIGIEEESESDDEY